MSAPELDEATIARWWHDQSAAQGLPDEIDPALIVRVATIAGAEDADGPAVGYRAVVRPSAAARNEGHGNATP